MSSYAKRIVIGFTIAVVVLGFAVVGITYLRAESVRDNCESVNQVRVVLQGIILRSAKVIKENPEYTLKEKEIGRKLNAQALKDLEPEKC